ncbi:hypothetical protein [Thiobacillus sp.]
MAEDESNIGLQALSLLDLCFFCSQNTLIYTLTGRARAYSSLAASGRSTVISDVDVLASEIQLTCPTAFIKKGGLGMRLKAPESWFSFLAVICLSSNALAAGMADIAGTYSVTFQPVTSAGKLEGCSLVYTAAMLDYVYQKGAAVMVGGSITYYQNDKQQPALALKLGLANALSDDQKTEPPYYAFIRTKNGTTAGAKFVSHDSDVSGYRIFLYQLTEKSVNVVGDLLGGVNPTIGFNRTPKGVDATFPLDLSVEETTASNDGQPQRKHSNAATEGFANCFAELASSLRAEKRQ